MADTPDTGPETTPRLSKYQQLYKADISVRCCGYEAGVDRVSDYTQSPDMMTAVRAYR